MAKKPAAPSVTGKTLSGRGSKTGKNPGRGGRFTAFLFLIIAAVTVALAAGFYFFGGDLSGGDFKRFFGRIRAGFGENPALSADVINFDWQKDSVLAAGDKGLWALNSNRFVCYDSAGGEKISAERAFGSPALSASGKYAAAFDRGGVNLLFSDGETFTVDRREGDNIITAKVNAAGYLALVTRGGGYKSVVTVCDGSGAEVFRYSSPKYYIVDADVSPDGKYLAVAAAEYSETEDWTTGRIIAFNTFSADTDEGLPCGFPRELFFGTNGALALLTEDGASFFTLGASGLAPAGDFPFGGEAPLDWSRLGDGIVLRLARNAAGSDGRLVSLGWDGKPLGEADAPGDVISQSGRGYYVTLVTAARILIYDSKLELVSDAPNDTNTRVALQRENGEMYFVYKDTARLYTP